MNLRFNSSCITTTRITCLYKLMQWSIHLRRIECLYHWSHFYIQNILEKFLSRYFILIIQNFYKYLPKFSSPFILLILGMMRLLPFQWMEQKYNQQLSKALIQYQLDKIFVDRFILILLENSIIYWIIKLQK